MDQSILTFDVSKKGTMDAVGDILFVQNEQSVREGVMNLLVTEPGSRIYDEYSYGCSLEKFLYQPLNINTAIRLKNLVKNCISKYEPRATNLNVVITLDKQNNTFIVDVYFVETITKTFQQVQLKLNKIR